MLTFKNGILQGVKFLPSPNVGEALVNPTLLVQHYTASGGSGEADGKFFQSPNAKASAHFVVDRDGTITQCVPINKKAWHAGKSAWRTRSNCNDFSIGIEIDNWGILTKRADGTFASWKGVVIPAANVIHAKNKRGIDGYWEAYPEAQLRAVLALSEALCEEIKSIDEIVGHEDIAPVRKTDPGPAFPMARFQSIPHGRENESITRTVMAEALNVRGGPGTNFDKLSATLKKGDKVEVILDAGDWSQIRTGSFVGWVFDQYLG
jgi:N-acetylmuramoyl-L-alanine amidase